MKKNFALLSVVFLASAAAAQVRFQGTLDQAVAKARTEKKLVIVDFYGSG